MNSSRDVVPIRWEQFAQYGELARKSPDFTDCAELVLNSARYNLAWMPGAAAGIERGERVTGGAGGAHDTIRPACGAAYLLAVVLKTGVFDDRLVGGTNEEATACTVRLIRAIAATHKGKWWGYPWQSALWASQLGHAAWLMWKELDPSIRSTVRDVIESEADRFIGYKVPYWNGKGGDTKAEENAWNASVLAVAVAMMPHHPNARVWKEKCSELMVSAFATKEDMQNEEVIDGRRVKDWIKGYNAREDGSVVNHGFIHPDYMGNIFKNLRPYVIQPLAGQTVPEAADFNLDLVYRCLVTRHWPSPPYRKPGGTIYVPGKARIYYPREADWGTYDYVEFYLVDTHVHFFGQDKGLPRKARDWMRVRAKGLLRMQMRHKDRRLYAKEERKWWVGCEQTSGHRLANTFLLHWIDAQKTPVKRGNWMK
jgi:hypothetical protein